ncbi:MAG TPA: hypothetical protein VG817_07740, partial [Gemmatimonadales bacterium]|nr:hypothetical protein [Gemmatimonadales bacterium]
MRTGLSQHTSLRQDLRINPRLYQAMDMLYMPMMDLQQHLKQELLSNPFLELLEPEEEDVTQGDQTPTKEEEKEKKDKEDETDWEEILLNGFEVTGGAREEFEEKEYTEPTSVESADLIDHLREQLMLMELTPRQQLLSEEFLGNIKEDGYLAATTDDILAQVNNLLDGHVAKRMEPTEDEEDEDRFDAAADETHTGPSMSAFLSPDQALGAEPIVTPVVAEPEVAPPPEPVRQAPPIPYFTMAEVEEMLAILQKLDPPGVCARDLRECLLIQLREAKDTESLTYRLVNEGFQDLIAHRWNDLGRRFGVEPAAVQSAADQLARLDPKPGLKYSAGGDGYVIPDLVVEKVEGQYRVFLNDTGVP